VLDAHGVTKVSHDQAGIIDPKGICEWRIRHRDSCENTARVQKTMRLARAIESPTIWPKRLMPARVVPIFPSGASKRAIQLEVSQAAHVIKVQRIPRALLVNVVDILPRKLRRLRQVESRGLAAPSSRC
jgi:hypothetical protein